MPTTNGKFKTQGGVVTGSKCKTRNEKSNSPKYFVRYRQTFYINRLFWLSQ